MVLTHYAEEILYNVHNTYAISPSLLSGCQYSALLAFLLPYSLPCRYYHYL